MAWTTPKTWVDDEVVEAVDLNAHVRDNLAYVHSGKPLTALKVTGGDYSGSGSSFADVDATNAAITLSVTTGRVRVTATVTPTTSSGHTVYFDVLVDGTRFANGTGGVYALEAGLGARSGTIDFYVTGLSTGSHIFKLQWNPNGTATTLAANANQPLLFAVEEV